ncbi:hypothetical protein ACXZ66_02225 [Corynebacterium sp. S7]
MYTYNVPSSTCTLEKRGHSAGFHVTKSLLSHGDWVDATDVEAKGNYLIFRVAGERFVRWHHNAKRAATEASHLRGIEGAVQFSPSAECLEVRVCKSRAGVFWLDLTDTGDKCEHTRSAEPLVGGPMPSVCESCGRTDADALPGDDEPKIRFR